MLLNQANVSRSCKPPEESEYNRKLVVPGRIRIDFGVPTLLRLQHCRWIAR